VGVGQTASGRSDKDTGLGQTVMMWVTQLEIVGWLLVGEGEGGVGWNGVGWGMVGPEG
jgi:hypothetical protein